MPIYKIFRYFFVLYLMLNLSVNVSSVLLSGDNKAVVRSSSQGVVVVVMLFLFVSTRKKILER